MPKTNNHNHCPEFNALAASKFLALLSVITCQWLDMSLHCWTPVQEHCTVCGFSEPMVFTKTVWTKCSAVGPTVLAKLLYAILHGPASVLQQTSASLTGSSTDVENLLLSALIQNISTLKKPCCRRETARCHCKFRSLRSVQADVFE